MPQSTIIITTDEFAEWFLGLNSRESEDVAHVVRMLEQTGVTLGAPYSSDIRGASFALRELRPKQGHSPLRIFYAFDPRRDAVLLLGGDKGGESTKGFYRSMIRSAEKIWTTYLAELEAGKHDE